MSDEKKIAAKCGAKNRAGNPCQRYPLKGRTRCKLHGGASTGPIDQRGNKNAFKHGGRARSLYAGALIGEEEQELFENIALGTLDAEIRMARVIANRIAVKLAAAAGMSETDSSGMLLEKAITKKFIVRGADGRESVVTRQEMVRSRPDLNALWAALDRYLKRISDMEVKRKAVLEGDSSSVEDRARSLATMIAEMDASEFGEA